MSLVTVSVHTAGRGPMRVSLNLIAPRHIPVTMGSASIKKRVRLPVPAPSTATYKYSHTYIYSEKKSKQRSDLSSPVIIEIRVAEPLWDLDGTISLLQPFRRPRAAGEVRSRRRPSSLCVSPVEGRRGTSQQLRGALLGGGGCVRARA